MIYSDTSESCLGYTRVVPEMVAEITVGLYIPYPNAQEYQSSLTKHYGGVSGWVGKKLSGVRLR